MECGGCGPVTVGLWPSLATTSEVEPIVLRLPSLEAKRGCAPPESGSKGDEGKDKKRGSEIGTKNERMKFGKNR